MATPFKVGDVVVITKLNSEYYGWTGVIRLIINRRGQFLHEVDLDKTKTTVWCPMEWLVPYIEKESNMSKFKVGDKVVISSGFSFFSGNHGVIVKVMDESGSEKDPYYKVFLEENHDTVWLTEPYLYSEKETPKFKIGDTVYVTDETSYTKYKFKNTVGCIVWFNETGDRVGVHFEGMYNQMSKNGRFYFPIESLKGEKEMTRPDGYKISFTVIDEVHNWRSDAMFKKLADISRRDAMCKSNLSIDSIDHVIFNPPATIIFWIDGSKTVVKCGENEEFDPEKGLAMAIAKKALGNHHDYYDTFWKHLPKEYKKSLKEKK